MINLTKNHSAEKNHFKDIERNLIDRIKTILRMGYINKNSKQVSLSPSLKSFLNYLLIGDELEKIISLQPENFQNIISLFNINYPNFSIEGSDDNIILYNIFVSSIYNKKEIFSKYDFIKNISIDSCTYCNRNYIYYLDRSSQVKPEIDHFFPKSTYPYLGISYYNLIPSCQTCNGLSLKGNKDPFTEDLVNPYLIDTKDFSFSYRLNSSAVVSGLLDKESVIVDIKGIQGHLDVFKLEKFYQQHADHVVELIYKSKIKYSFTYREYLKKYDSVGLKFKKHEIDRMILGNYSRENEIHKRPLAKMYQDIGRDLGLIKFSS